MNIRRDDDDLVEITHCLHYHTMLFVVMHITLTLGKYIIPILLVEIVTTSHSITICVMYSIRQYIIHAKFWQHVVWLRAGYTVFSIFTVLLTCFPFDCFNDIIIINISCIKRE